MTLRRRGETSTQPGDPPQRACANPRSLRTGLRRCTRSAPSTVCPTTTTWITPPVTDSLHRTTAGWLSGHDKVPTSSWPRRTWGEQGDGVSLSVRPRWLGPNRTPERSARTVTQVIETVSDCQLAGYVDQSCIAFLGNTFQQLKGSNRVDVEAGYKDSLGLPGEVSARQCAAKPALVSRRVPRQCSMGGSTHPIPSASSSKASDRSAKTFNAPQRLI